MKNLITKFTGDLRGLDTVTRIENTNLNEAEGFLLRLVEAGLDKQQKHALSVLINSICEKHRTVNHAGINNYHRPNKDMVTQANYFAPKPILHSKTLYHRNPLPSKRRIDNPKWTR